MQSTICIYCVLKISFQYKCVDNSNISSGPELVDLVSLYCTYTYVRIHIHVYGYTLSIESGPIEAD
jgi:hypothetical protein